MSQPVVVSPLPNGIVQIKPPKEAGLLRIVIRSGREAGDRVLAVDYKLATDKGEPILDPFWSALKATEGKIDTTIVVPFLSKSFTFHYKIVTPDSIYTGSSYHLRIGHIFAIAGQSNAQGWSPPPYPQPDGDVWVLRNFRYWEYGAIPSGLRWNGPWIYMANYFQKLVNDSLPIGIVNMAKGGTSLVAHSKEGNWQRNDASPEDVTTPYGHALRTFRSAGSNFEALFWIQGEADVVSTTCEEYREGFKELVENFETDLDHSPEFYHLQISGQKLNDGGPSHFAWAYIREAHRSLHKSTLVGSAISYPLSFDGIHYERITTEAVGHRFAAAHAWKHYKQPSPLFPPIEIDSALLVYEDTTEPELGMKVVIRCRQGDNNARFLPGQPFYGFELKQGIRRYDTTQVVARVHPKLPGWIEVRIMNQVIHDTDGWSVSYAIRGDPGRANAMDTCTASVLPNALVAFMDEPIVVGEEVTVPVADVRQRQPGRNCTYTLFDISGKTIETKVTTRPEEWRKLFPPGIYLYRVDCEDGSFTGKWLIPTP